MATQQEINDAVRLNEIINAQSYGYDSSIHAKRDAADFERLGGEARFNQLMSDPQVYQHISAGSGNPLVSTLKEAAPYLALAGGLYGLNSLGVFGAGTTAPTGMGAFTAEQLASPVLAGGAGSGQGLSLATLSGAVPAASAIPGVASAAQTAAGAVPATAGAAIPAAGAGGAGGVTSAIPSLGGLSANTLGSLASGAASLYGAQQGVNAAQDATAELRRQFDIGQANARPWLEAGKSALGAQQELMGLGGQSPEQQLAALTNSPGYKFRFDQGQQARERSAAARGMLNSGNVLAGLTEYGQNFASNEYGNRLNQLAGLSGTGQTQANANMATGMNYAGEMGNASLAAGNARMSGALGVGSALSNIFNPPKEQPTFKMVNGQWSYV